MKPVITIPKDWKTPATDYKLEKVGLAEIDRINYNKGYYLMEGVLGKNFFKLKHKIPVTLLKYDGNTLMVDDPLHWIGMQELAKRAAGRVLTSGLGLGLLINALLQNKEVKEIHVVEINQDIIKLVSPYVTNPKVKIIKGNIWDTCSIPIKETYDTVILDLWDYDESNPINDKKRAYIEMVALAHKFKNQTNNVYIWGLRDPELNPAVEVAK